MGNEARIVTKRLRLSFFNSFYVTVTELRNGLRNYNLNLTHRCLSFPDSNRLCQINLCDPLEDLRGFFL
jgi:hypothetical protein